MPGPRDRELGRSLPWHADGQHVVTEESCRVNLSQQAERVSRCAWTRCAWMQADHGIDVPLQLRGRKRRQNPSAG